MNGSRRFRWLLRLLPFEMREAHGRDMAQVFQDSSRGRGRGLRFWTAVVLDILRIAPRQHAEALLQDVRYAARTFRIAPAFTLTAVATVALGVGAATAVFAVANALLLRPLPFHEPERMAIVWTLTPEGNRTWLAAPELQDIRERVPAFGSVAGLTDLKLVLTGAGDPEELQAIGASSNLPAVFGVGPALGAWFDGATDVPNGPDVVVLSDDLWRSRFGARHDVIGARIQLNGRPHTVVGVMPRRFAVPPPSSVFPSRVDAWVPLQSNIAITGRDVRLLHVIGRLAPGASPAHAREQAREAGRIVSASYPEYRGQPWTFDAIDLQADLSRTVRPALVLLLGIVALVLLIAAANVAALLLSRGAARQQEIAIRIALGASSARLVRQLVTEALALGLLGAAAGLAVVAGLVEFARTTSLAAIPRFTDTAVDVRVAAFAMSVSMLMMVVVALAPLVLQRGSRGSREALRVRGRSHGAIRAGRVLTAIEIAVACTVLVVALLLARGFGELMRTDPGFRTDSILTFRVSLPAKYKTPTEMNAFFDRALEQLRALPGAEEAAAVTQLPLSGAALGSTFLLAPADGARVDADLRGITPSYLDTMQIPLVAGRAFTAADGPDAPWVAIVDEQFARRAWPNESPVGKRIRWFRVPNRELEVVGVVRPVRHRGFDAPPRETVYRPHAQYARPTMFVAVRTAGAESTVARAAAEAVRSVDPDQPIADVAQMASLAARSLAQPGLAAGLSSAFALIAIVLTAVGTYGVFAFAVGQRTREVGVRLALGSTPRQIVSLIMREGLGLAAIGLAAGIPTAWLAASAAQKSLGLATGVDVSTITAALAVILVTTAIACGLPSRRASRVSPAEPLRG